MTKRSKKHARIHAPRDDSDRRASKNSGRQRQRVAPYSAEAYAKGWASGASTSEVGRREAEGQAEAGHKGLDGVYPH